MAKHNEPVEVTTFLVVEQFLSLSRSDLNQIMLLNSFTSSLGACVFLHFFSTYHKVAVTVILTKVSDTELS